LNLARRQFELLRSTASLDPAPYLMGGYAEDALLAGTVTRPHDDLDWILPRRELELRLAQAEGLGSTDFETLGEAAPGEPFYLCSELRDLKLELGIAEEEDGALWVKVGQLFFPVAGQEAPARYRVRLPEDTFDYPPVELDGIELRVASPLALYQIRIGISGQGSFGELTEKQQLSARSLRDRFFADRDESELEPLVERLEA
jgi:hypothetical protein